MSEHTPPPDLVQKVKSALGAWYDLPRLQRSALLALVQPQAPAEGAGQQLRRELIEGIESLNPGPGTAFRAPNARPFHLLHLHYVEGLPIQETGRELGLSERQTYRDLRQAELSLASVLWERWQPPRGPRAVELTTADREMARWETQLAPANLAVLVQQASDAVARLAADLGVTLQCEPPPDLPPIATDVALARQVLVLVFSHAVRSAADKHVRVELAPAAPDDAIDDATVHLRVRWGSGAAGELPLAAAAPQLAQRLGWQLGAWAGAIDLSTSTATPPAVLIVDDNEGLIQLLEHYLTEQQLRVIVAADGAEGLHAARSAQPAAIILDVMMPGLDGWELLQRLRVDPLTAAIPVIVCSFIHDPELARSLGANLFVPKPVRRDEILAALRQVMAR
jgi:CheY-like chemotaxis protein